MNNSDPTETLETGFEILKRAVTTLLNDKWLQEVRVNVSDLNIEDYNEVIVFIDDNGSLDIR